MSGHSIYLLDVATNAFLFFLTFNLVMRLDLIPDQRFERFFLAREIDIVTKVRWKFWGSNSF